MKATPKPAAPAKTKATPKMIRADDWYLETLSPKMRRALKAAAKLILKPEFRNRDDHAAMLLLWYAIANAETLFAQMQSDSRYARDEGFKHVYAYWEGLATAKPAGK